MRNALLVSATLILALPASGSPSPTTQVRASGGALTAKIDVVGFLHGCWELRAGARLVEEQWTTPRGGIMLGVGRTTNDGKLVEHESVVLREQGDHLEYEAHPSGQPQAVFVSKEMTADRVVFENPAHDFPQRVGYERQGDAMLLAWVEGTANGRSRRVEFPYSRVPCDQQSTR